jgi:ribonuclease-3
VRNASKVGFDHRVGNRLSKAEWTQIQQDLVSNSNLGRRGFELGLDRCIITVPGLERVSTNMMATTVEAILGAVFEDSGANDLSAVRAVVEAMGLHRHFLLVTFTSAPFLLLYRPK